MMEKIKEERKEIKKDKIEKGKKREKKNNPVVYTAKYDCIHVCSMKFYLAI
jgi:hypothetical protein